MAGARNSKVFEESLQLPESVIEVGFVTDAELRTLYEAAACFVFPSFYEGFGLPPLEALALGCPVVASATASMPEVLGDVVFYCDPSKPEDIAEQIQRAIDTPPDRENNMKHAAKFTWEKCAAQTWEVVMRASGR